LIKVTDVWPYGTCELCFYLRISSFYKREWHPFRGGRSINLDNCNFERPLGTGRQIEIKDSRRPCKEKKKYSRKQRRIRIMEYNTIIQQVAPLLWPRKGKAFFLPQKGKAFYFLPQKGKGFVLKKDLR
jgi:hypothetical protein